MAGDYAWRTGLTETAVSELQAVVAISNATPLFQSLAHAGLAQIAAANGQPAAAIDALSASLTAWPGNADAQARRGDLALTAGDAAAAATAYQQALALLADYRQQLGSDSAALLEVTILAPGPGDASARCGCVLVCPGAGRRLALVEPAPQWPRPVGVGGLSSAAPWPAGDELNACAQLGAPSRPSAAVPNELGRRGSRQVGLADRSCRRMNSGRSQAARRRLPPMNWGAGGRN
ncbi:MAG: tetratricopeptide repeat protein [Anaerolineae bacterium]|nr:tetratricopeptide repeat protein [Anaerolineae bacterium]